MTLRSAAKSLLVLALALPVMQATLQWVAGLLASMGDAAGAEIVRHIATACQVVWAVGLVGLVIVLALVVLNEESRESRVKSQEPEDSL
jgi:cobalamin biosynthesis protein CbiD